MEKKKKTKILKKSSTSYSYKNRNNILTKPSKLKAKKNQLRCHYCKFLMLRSNYARHLKLHDSNNKYNKKNENNRNKKLEESYSSYSNSKSISESNSLNESSKESIPQISKSEQNSEILTYKENEKSVTKSEIVEFYNEFSNFEENKIYFIIKFGINDFNGTIIYKFPNTEKYNIYTFPKPSFIWEKAISKYDIPQLYFNRPTGFSIFSSISDIKVIKQFYITNHEKYILHEFSNIKKRYIEGMHIYINKKSYSEWNILYKKLHNSSDKEDTILIEIFFPDEFPFEKPLIKLDYYNIGFKNKCINNNEYRIFIKNWKPHNTIEELLLQIKETIDNTYKYYQLKNIDEEKKKCFEAKIKLILENSIDRYKTEEFNIENLVKKNKFFEQNKDIIKEDIIEPVPMTLYCNICKIKFIEYKSHINSKNHIRNLKQINFNNIKETFKRIVKNNTK